MALALWSRPCRNECCVKRQPGYTSNLSRCSRPYALGGARIVSAIPDRNGKLANLGADTLKAVKVVYEKCLPLLDARDDYRRVLLVIPWTLLVASYLLLGIPILCVFRFYANGFEWYFKVDVFEFSELYEIRRHKHLRDLVASRSSLAVPLMLLFWMDCLLLGIASILGYGLIVLTMLCLYGPMKAFDMFFIGFREGEIDLFQHTCCQCLTQKECQAQLGMDFSFERDACRQCKLRDGQWMWMGCAYGCTSGALELVWKQVARGTGELLTAKGSMLLEDPGLSGLRFPYHTTVLPQWVLQHCSSALTSLDLSSCRCLQRLPIADILKLPLLTSLSCVGCSQLWSIPQEICSQGGEATMLFLREVERTGQICTSVALFLIGDGEAGKTSIIMSLKSENDTAFHIRTDHRTIGIDISKWAPEGQHIDFTVFDLAGQSVYLQTHQLFLLRRAVYLLVWRPPDGARAVSDLTTNLELWLQCLQNRIPGAFVMLAVTHIDLVDPDALASVCAKVKSAVLHSIRIMQSHAKEGMRVLSVWGQGASLPVNSLSGDGIPHLRREVIAFAKSMPWYGESLPSSWMVLKEELKNRERKEDGTRVPSLSWNEYSRIALDPPCSIPPEALASVTSFLHDSCVIRYFGDVKAEGGTESIVYISTTWMMDVIKGLMRHDRQALTDFFIKERNKRMLRHTNRLIRYGMLHEDLVPFLWPEQDASKAFWRFVAEKGSREADVWSSKIVSTNRDGQTALELLKGFNLIGDGTDAGMHMAPGVLPPALLPCCPALYVKECPSTATFMYTALPAGAFHSIVVGISKATGVSVETGPSYAVIHTQSHDVAQLFYLQQSPSNTVQRCSFWPCRAAKPSDQLIVRSSSAKLLDTIAQIIHAMEQQYAGLVRLANTLEPVWSNLENPPSLVWIKAASSNPSAGSICNGCSSSGSSATCDYVFNRRMCIEQYKSQGSRLNLSVQCPQCRHSRPLFDLLTHFHVPERCPCPCCVESGQPNPGEFNAGECRLKLTDDASARNNDLVTCHTCLGAGRLGQIRIMDVISPDVFVSGHDTVPECEQDTIDVLLQSIEVDADIIISNRSGQSEALSRLEDTRVVLILLSDAYAQSATCREEFRAAVSSCLPLVPVLMPRLSGIDAWPGWTGPGPSDRQYWRHAADVCRAIPLAMDAEACTDWSFLEHFPPLQFGHDSEADNLPASIPCLSAEAAKLIQARLHRPGRVESYSDFSMLGVRLSFFDHFVDSCGGRSALQGLSTSQVMQTWVIPYTERSKLSFCEQLVAEGKGTLVGTATWFYSHAWKYLFLDVVDAAQTFFRQAQGQAREEDPVVWFDIFSVSQHKAEVRPFEWWSSVFLNSIGAIGRVLMVMQPFDDNRLQAWVTLTRVWCVFELYACEATLSEFHVTMTAGMAARFRQAMLSEDRGWLTRLASLDCEQSEAFKAEDKERVFDAIRRTVGFPLLNSTVLRVMEKWLASRFLAAERTRGSPESPDYPKLLHTVVEAVQALQRRREHMAGIAGDHPHSLAAMHTLVELYREQGRLAEARAACAACAGKRARVLGKEHADTRASEMLLAELSTGHGMAPAVLRGEAQLGACLVVAHCDT